MGHRPRSLLLRLAVGYPAALLADALDTARYRQQSRFDLLVCVVCVPVRHAAAHLAPRNDAELTLIGLMVAVSAYTLALWLLPV